jgi:hypothetical protein
MIPSEHKKAIMSLVVEIINSTFLKRLIEFNCQLTL